jgi:hypothetical protein
MNVPTSDKLKLLGLSEDEWIHLTDLTITDNMIADMRFYGCSRPPLITPDKWGKEVREYEMTPRQKRVIYLSAMGRTPIQIAEELGYSNAGVTNILRKPGVQERIAHQQSVIFQNDMKGWIKTLMTKSYGVIDEILTDHDEKSSVKLEAAKYVIDHVVGKATQNVEVSGNLLGDLITQLDEIKNTPIEPSYVAIPVDAGLADATAEKALVAMDDLVSQLIQTEHTVGKRG